jgi:hypothetical protein
VGAGFLNVAAGARGTLDSFEGFARAEAGMHFMPTGSVFGFGEVATAPGAPLAWQAGIGARVTW